jgi:hypothetical protein
MIGDSYWTCGVVLTPHGRRGEGFAWDAHDEDHREVGLQIASQP